MIAEKLLSWLCGRLPLLYIQKCKSATTALAGQAARSIEQSVKARYVKKLIRRVEAIIAPEAYA